ncbi:MAG: RNA methyltransferase [Chloroflexi bacterium]|nr:RNA methyltransferase [Chloroflexota bacterium]
MQRITSLHNSKVKLVHRLRNKRGRQSESRFLVEYQRDLQRALLGGYELDFLMICPALLESQVLDIGSAQDAIEVTPQILKRLTYRERPSGFLAVMKAKSAKVLRDLEKSIIDSAILLVGPRKPGNVGALLRTGNAAGIDAMLLVDCALDLYNPNIIRNSAGACFCDKIYQLSSAEAITYFRDRGFQLIAADGRGETSLFDLDLRQKTAIALGPEDAGLDARWLGICDRRVRIPMTGILADSLNLSVSGAIFMYEILRQRQTE